MFLEIFLDLGKVLEVYDKVTAFVVIYAFDLHIEFAASVVPCIEHTLVVEHVVLPYFVRSQVRQRLIGVSLT